MGATNIGGTSHEETRFTVIAEPELPDLETTVEQELYRIIQEALNNIVRHAQAQHASVRITSSVDMLTIRITDDGIGFNPVSVSSNQRHFGLR